MGSPSSILACASLALVGGCTLLFVEERPAGIEAVHVELFMTDSVDFVAVPGAELALDPPAAGGAWLVFASAAVESSDGSIERMVGDAELRVDGERRAGSGIWNTLQNRPVSWLHALTLSDDRQHTVTVALRSARSDRTARISGLRLVGLHLPAAADLHSIDGDSVVEVLEPDWTTQLTLTVEPASPGEYLIIAAGAIAEADYQDAQDISVRLLDPTGTSSPELETGFIVNRAAVFPVFWARTIELTVASLPFHLEARLDGGEIPGLLHHPRLMALRTDAFGARKSVHDLEARVVECGEQATTALSSGDLAPGLDYLAIQGLTVLGAEDPPRGRAAAFWADGEPQTTFVRHSSRAKPHVPDGLVTVFRRGSLPAELENRAGCDGEGMPVSAVESVIHLLGAPPTGD